MEMGSLWLEVAVPSPCAPEGDKEEELGEDMQL